MNTKYYYLLLSLAISAWAPLVTLGEYVEEYEDHFTNDFVVRIDGDGMVADLVAQSHGFKYITQLESLGNNLFHFTHDEITHRSKRSAENILEQLSHDPNVLDVMQQRVLIREKKSVLDHARNMVYDKQTELERPEVDQEAILERYFGNAGKRSENPCEGTEYERGIPEFNDKYLCLQWYLFNNGEAKGEPGYDINVKDAWKKYTGRGVKVCVLDDGLDHAHLEIKDNYDPKASYDLNDLKDEDHDPQPPTSSSSTAHGTRCAGEIAGAADNGVCGVGVAFNANIGGVRLLDGSVTDKLEAQALSFKKDYIDVYSSSWGPRDDGKTTEGPNTLTTEALKRGAEEGRDGKGNIFSWATGNGGAKDDCNADGYVSSIYTLSVGSINDKGLSVYFSEICPSTLAVCFTGGSHKPPGDSGYAKPDISIITADTSSNTACDLDFEGTSSAAPLFAGCAALVLEANPDITWRDMQHLVVETARISNSEEDGWLYNGAGYHVNHKFGFGVIDCSAMTALAVMWTEVGEHLNCDIDADNDEFTIPGGKKREQTLTVSEHDCDIERLEHTLVHIKYTTTYRGDMSIHIVSASGTDSEILSTRPEDKFSGDFEWTFMTTHNWNEGCVGDWVLSIEDQGPHHRHDDNEFEVTEWSLTFYGSKGDNPNEDIVKANKPVRAANKEVNQACKLPSENLHEVMHEEQKSYEILNNAVEKGTKFSRESIEDLAREVLDSSDFDLFEKILHEDDNEIQQNPPPTNFGNKKPDTSHTHNADEERKRAHLYVEGDNAGESDIQERFLQGQISNNYADVNQRGKNLYGNNLYPENREMKLDENLNKIDNEDLTDEEILETVRLLEEILEELD